MTYHSDFYMHPNCQSEMDRLDVDHDNLCGGKWALTVLFAQVVGYL